MPKNHEIIDLVEDEPPMRVFKKLKPTTTIDSQPVLSSEEQQQLLVVNKKESETTHREHSADDDDDDDDDDDEVEIIDAPVPAAIGVSSIQNTCGNNDDDNDDVQIIGSTNAVSLPHMRCHCTEHPYVVDLTNSKDNEKSCTLCYCYVCDIPVQECHEWKKHCHASDKIQSWKLLRKQSRPCPFSASIDDARKLKWIVEALRVVSNVCVLTCHEDGIEVKEYHQSAFCVDLWLGKEFFSSYQCNEKFEMTVENMEHFAKLLRKARKKDGTLSLQGRKDSLQLSYEDTDPQILALSQTSLMNESFEIPFVKYSACIQIPVKDFQQVTQTFSSILTSSDCLLTICCKNDMVEFSCGDPTGLVRRASIQYTSSKRVQIDCSKDVKLSFKMKLLEQLAKVPDALARSMTLQMKAGIPLKVEYLLTDGHISYHLSPSVKAIDV